MVETAHMNTSNELLNRFAQVGGFSSDYQIAKALGTTSSFVSAVRHGKSHLGPTSAVQIAETLGLDPLTVIAQLQSERAPNERVKTVWARYCARVLLAFVGTSVMFQVPPADAEPIACNV